MRWGCTSDVAKRRERPVHQGRCTGRVVVVLHRRRCTTVPAAAAAWPAPGAALVPRPGPGASEPGASAALAALAAGVACS